MPTKVDPDTCTGCEACVEACPVEAITMKDEIAVVDQDECTDCGACVDTCPVESITVDE